MKVKKVLSLIIAFVLLTSSVALAAIGDPGEGRRWTQSKSGGYRYENEWFQENDGRWVYFGDDGYTLQNTWFQDTDGRWYYFDNNCYMMTDASTPDGYYVDVNGVWLEQ